MLAYRRLPGPQDGYNGAMQRWEYKTVDFSKPKRDVEDLNRLGAEGWEAVSMVTTWGVSEMRFAHPIVLLKRAIPDESAEQIAPTETPFPA
jgi:hypothetical protein